MRILTSKGWDICYETVHLCIYEHNRQFVLCAKTSITDTPIVIAERDNFNAVEMILRRILDAYQNDEKVVFVEGRGVEKIIDEVVT